MTAAPTAFTPLQIITLRIPFHTVIHNWKVTSTIQWTMQETSQRSTCLRKRLRSAAVSSQEMLCAAHRLQLGCGLLHDIQHYRRGLCFGAACGCDIYMNNGGPTVAICGQSCTANVAQAAQQTNWPLSCHYRNVMLLFLCVQSCSVASQHWWI